MASYDNNKINIDIIKQYQSSFVSEKDTFINAYTTYKNSYLNTCSDSCVISINNKIQNLYNTINQGYNNIDNWLSEYLQEITTLEKKLITDLENDLDSHTTYNASSQNLYNRYLDYKQLHPELSFQEVMLFVNMNLDCPFYSNAKIVKDTNTDTMLVNKYNQLTADYVPSNLVKIDKAFATKNIQLQKQAKDAFINMCKDAKKSNCKIKAASGYRSYEYQENLYNNYVKKDGVELADTYSARPGFSEHQTGLAVDVTKAGSSYEKFGDTKEFQWMQDNAHKYGFILRYPNNKSHITGYKYEPWHYRYVGVEIASYIHHHDITFDEYYSLFLDNIEKL